MSGTQGGGLGTVVAYLIAGLIQIVVGIFRVLLWVFGLSREARLRREAARAEHAARVQRQQWFELMQKQMARGTAGDATAEEAVAALHGSGGNSSTHDKEFF